MQSPVGHVLVVVGPLPPLVKAFAPHIGLIGSLMIQLDLGLVEVGYLSFSLGHSLH